MNIYDDFGKGLHIEHGIAHPSPKQDTTMFHMHPHYELLLVPDAAANTTIINGRTMEIGHPVAILTAPFAMHFTYFREAATPPVRHCALYFDESFIHSFGENDLPVKELLGDSNAVILDITSVAERMRKLSEIMMDMAPSSWGKASPATYSQGLMAAILFHQLWDEVGLRRTSEVRVSEKNYISDVMKYIVSNLNNNLTIPTIAEHFFISRDKLCRDFRRHVQMNIGDFVSTARLNLARKCLKDGMLTVKEIATRCGFENDVYFYSFFKKHEGCTPKEYAKRYQSTKK